MSSYLWHLVPCVQSVVYINLGLLKAFQSALSYFIGHLLCLLYLVTVWHYTFHIRENHFLSCFREFHASDWSLFIAIKPDAMALFLFLWRKELRLYTPIVANPAIVITKADRAFFLHTGVSLLVSCENLWQAEAGSWKVPLAWEYPEPYKDCSISSFKIF